MKGTRLHRVLAALGAALFAWSVPPAPAAVTPDLGDVQDIPETRYVPTRPVGRPPLRRTRDLLLDFLDGSGTLSPPPSGARPKGAAVLPARTALGRAGWLLQWSVGPTDVEEAKAFALDRDQSWCQMDLRLAAGTRLRMEPVAWAGPARLEVTWRRPGRADLSRSWDVGQPGPLAAKAGLDLELAEGTGTLCLAARLAPLAVTEPRLLEPEPAGSDARPRWLVIDILDTVRADAADPEVGRRAPRIAAMARSGLVYTRAYSPGLHTRAAVLPLLTGREVVRIDPWLRVAGTASYSAAARVQSRPNLLLTNLAASAGYHTVGLGNNGLLLGHAVFSRFSQHGQAGSGTLDTVARLPDLLARYSDERLLLVYYVSAAHTQSAAPRRLIDALGCPSMSTARERAVCAYDARVGHTDEAVGALLDGLADHRIESALHVLTSDHGELLKEGWGLQGVERFDKWLALDEGHGYSPDPLGFHVPLVVTGPGVSPSRLARLVSTLDLVPALQQILGIPSSARLDGVALPAFPGTRETRPPERGRWLASYGYCAHSLLQEDRQLVWWEAECSRRRDASGGAVHHSSELWEHGRLAATEISDPVRIRPAVDGLLQRIAERLPGEALVLDTAPLGGRGTVSVEVSAGRISDHGPVLAAGHLDGIRAELAPDERRLEVRLDGYRGLFAVSTWPPAIPVTVRAWSSGEEVQLATVGSLQLPLQALGVPLDPGSAGFWLRSASGEPSSGTPTSRPHLRLWWEPYEGRPVRAEESGLSQMDQVLREWGYIR